MLNQSINSYYSDTVYCLTSKCQVLLSVVCVDEYCTEPQSIHSGFFMCKPSQCDSFRAGTELHYVCNKNYKMRAGDEVVLTCLPGGVWSREPPVCLPGQSSHDTLSTRVSHLRSHIYV